ncbi:MAG: hypothetical protein F2595_03220, partial [Actinobacteria bacterium]|nr:hypothetical protein [Actinomycetota bacterium]
MVPARRNASSVFSRSARDAPRWAITCTFAITLSPSKDLFFHSQNTSWELCPSDCHLATSLVVFFFGGSPLEVLSCALRPNPNRRKPDVSILASSLALGSADYTWRNDATCRDTDPELFFPFGTTGQALLQIAKAKSVCCECPVNIECLDFALETNQDTG